MFWVPPDKRGLVAAVLTALLLATADMSVVSTLLPLLAEAFDGSPYSPRLVSIFMATMAFSGLSAGALADRYGQNKVLRGAMTMAAQ